MLKYSTISINCIYSSNYCACWNISQRIEISSKDLSVKRFPTKLPSLSSNSTAKSERQLWLTSQDVCCIMTDVTLRG